MKNKIYFWIIVTSCLLLTISMGLTQTVTTLWSQTYGEFVHDGPWDKALMVQLKQDGGFLLSGSRLILTDSNGNSQHDEQLNGSLALVTNDGGLVTTEIVNNSVSLIKKDAGMQNQWFIYLSTPYLITSVNDIAHSNDGGYVLCGKTGMDKPWWVKVDEQGNIIWTIEYYDPGDGEMFSIQPMVDGGYILCGTFTHFAVLIKIDESGTVLWTKSNPVNNLFNPPYIGGKYALQNPDSSIAYCYNDINPAHEEAFIVFNVTDENGNILIQQSLDGYNWSSLYANHMARTFDGGYIVAAHTMEFWDPISKAWVIRLDSQGNELWRRQFTGNGYDQRAYDVLPLDANTYVMAGQDMEDYGFGDHGSQPWLVKFKEYMVDQIDFNATNFSGAVPFAVQFHDLSLGVPLHRTWDFGDGETSDEKDPLHVYRDPGYYTVKLTLSDGEHTFVEEKPNYIYATPTGTESYNVLPKRIIIDGDISDWEGVEHLTTMGNPDNPFPESELSGAAMLAWNGHDTWYMAFDVTDDFIGHNTQYSSFAHDPDSGRYGISRYWWNDCIEAIFAKDAGNDYFDALKIIFAPDEPERALYQGNHVPGHSWLEWGDLNSILAPEGDRSAKIPPVCSTKVTIDANHWYGEAALSINSKPPPDSVYRFIFSFNDVDDNSGATIRHHVNTTGGDIDVWDALAQLFGSMPILNFVDDQLHTAFTADSCQGYRPLTVQFTDQSLGLINSWLWDFGDGQTSSLRNPQHTYEQAGTFTVRLIINGPAGSDTLALSEYITVLENKPIANFEALPIYGQSPLEVHFTDLSQGLVDTWYWDFGDSMSSNEQNPVHVYTTPDTFSVLLRVTGPGGADSILKEKLIIAQLQSAVDDVSAANLPNSFALYNCYPNPFNSATTISYDLPKAVHVDLSVYNIRGEKLATIVNTRQMTGRYKYQWNSKGLASGVYFVVLKTVGFQKQVKIVLLQ